MRLTVDLPTGHPMRDEAPSGMPARRLLASRLAELASDLGAPPLELDFVAADDYRLRLDDELLRMRRRGGKTDRELRPSPALRLPEGWAEAESACTPVLEDLLAQRQRLAPAPAPSLRILPPPPAISIAVGSLDELASPADRQTREEALATFNASLFPTTGLLLPALTLQVDESLTGGQFRVVINGVRLPPRFGPCSDEVLVEETLERVQVLVPAAQVRPCSHPETGLACALVPAEASLLTACREAGMRVLSPLDYRFSAALAAIRRQAADFLGDDAVALMRQRTELIFSRLAHAAAEMVGDEVLGEVLRALAEEGVSVRNLWLILRSLTGLRALTNAEAGGGRMVFGPTDGGLGHGHLSGRLSRYPFEALLSAVRMGLHGEITQQWARREPVLQAISVSKPIDLAFARGPTATEISAWRHALGRRLGGALAGARKPVVISSVMARRALWDAIRIEHPDIAVLAYQEVSPQVDLRFQGRVDWDLPLSA